MTTPDPDLSHRVPRFLLTVGIPVTAALVLGVHSWLVYAVLGAIVSFIGDTGGPPVQRLGHMAIGPLALVAGATIGTASMDLPPAFLLAAFVLGFYYGLIEGGHEHLLLLARFLGYGLVMGHSVAPLGSVDCVAAIAVILQSWVISVLWDHLRGRQRPDSAGPIRPALAAAFLGWRTRWHFALCAGICMVAASVAGTWLGLGHPHWATLTVLVVMRSDLGSGAEMVTDRVLGTIAGVAIVAVLLAVVPSHGWLLACMTLAAATRWPAANANNALGVVSVAVFALLLAELVAPTAQAGMHVLQDRMLAIMVGCCFAMAATGLNRHLDRYLNPAAQPGGQPPVTGSCKTAGR